VDFVTGFVLRNDVANSFPEFRGAQTTEPGVDLEYAFTLGLESILEGIEKVRLSASAGKSHRVPDAR